MNLILWIILSVCCTICNAQVLINLTENSTNHFSPAEMNALEEFRALVVHLIPKEYERTDAYLIPWLRARKLDVPKAVVMFRNALKWRKEKNIDTITEENIVEINPPPYVLGGYDREGHPITIFTPAVVDIRRKLLQGIGFDKIYRAFIQAVEKGLIRRRPASLKFEKEITQVVTLFDFAGFNLRQHGCWTCIPWGREIFNALENYYPGIMRHFVFINVPRIALPFIEIVKPLMSESTRKVLKSFGTDRAEWSAYLHTIISPDQLPYRFGGTMKI